MSRKWLTWKAAWSPATPLAAWNRSDLTTVRADQDELSLLVAIHQSPKALLAINMVALKLLGVV